MPDYGDLTDLQLTIMSVLWSQRDATIGAIHTQLNEGGATPVARKTIAMLLSRLEQRGLVSHRMDGREGVYRARVAKKSVLRSRMASLLGAVFIGQPRLAGAHALDPADVRAGDVETLVAMLRQLERDVQKES
jgi:BlaI family penicillinase repressor